MRVVLGTFNLNNLFSRWNFKARAEKAGGPSGPVLDKRGGFWLRHYRGKLIQPKDARMTRRLAERILEVKPDVLAVQEVEDKDTLALFDRDHLRSSYPYRVLVEGNDPRLIDVALLSKLPVGEVRSHHPWVHRRHPHEPIFRRDLLQVEIRSPDRRKRLFWVVVLHLKSKYVDWRVKDAAKKKLATLGANRTRKLEAESAAAILSSRLPPREPYFVCGDCNDTSRSAPLRPLLGRSKGQLRLLNLVERDLSPEDRWTTVHRDKGATRRPNRPSRRFAERTQLN